MKSRDVVALLALIATTFFGCMSAQPQLCNSGWPWPFCVGLSNRAENESETPARRESVASPTPQTRSDSGSVTRPAPTSSAPRQENVTPGGPAPHYPETSPQQPPQQQVVPTASGGGGDRAEFERMIRGYLDSVSRQHGGSFRAAEADLIADMMPGMAADWQIRLERGVTYRIVGVCDNDCGDVDLEVLDAGGAVIGRDVLDNDSPIVDVRPARSANFTVRVMLPHCVRAPCFVGARVLRDR